MTRSELLRNGVSLQTELAKSLPRIRGHPTELQQVILNLIMNAVEAMSESSKGWRDLRISTAENRIELCTRGYARFGARIEPGESRSPLPAVLHDQA
jgi:C4-dicarboxylate-specific signal transduction histidine kinase